MLFVEYILCALVCAWDYGLSYVNIRKVGSFSEFFRNELSEFWDYLSFIYIMYFMIILKFV